MPLFCYSDERVCRSSDNCSLRGTERSINQNESVAPGLTFPWHTFTWPQRPLASLMGPPQRYWQRNIRGCPDIKSTDSCQTVTPKVRRKWYVPCSHSMDRLVFQFFNRWEVGCCDVWAKAGGPGAMNGPFMRMPRPWSITAIMYWICPSEGAVKCYH